MDEEIDEDLSDMYGLVEDNDEDMFSSPPLSTPFVQPKGKFQEIHVNGQKILIPDAAIIVNMETTIRILKEKINRLEHNLQTATFNIRKLEGYINRTNKELNTKVSYDS